MLTKILSDANQLILNGLYVAKDDFNAHETPARSFLNIPLEKPITSYTTIELFSLKGIFAKAESDWQDYNDMEFEEQCYFYADYLIPDLRDSSCLFTVEQFRECLAFAQENMLISQDHCEALAKDADYYCQQVFAQRYKSENYPLFKEIILRAKRETSDKDNKERYSEIPEEAKREIEQEIHDENKFQLGKTLLRCWFTFLQTGFFQTRIYQAGNPNKPLDPTAIDMEATFNTLNHGFTWLWNVSMTAGQFFDQQLTTLAFGFIRMAEAKNLKENPPYLAYPGFIRGTTAYTKKESQPLCESYTQIHNVLYPKLNGPSTNTTVIIFGEENHDKSVMTKLMVLNWLGQWFHSQDQFKSVNIIHEVEYPTHRNAKEDMLALNNLFASMVEASSIKPTLDYIYQVDCIDKLNSKDFRFFCPALVAKTHGFKFTAANIAIKDKSIDEQTRNFLNKYPTLRLHDFNRDTVYHLPDISYYSSKRILTLDKKIIDTTLFEVNKKSSALTVVFVGYLHLDPLYKKIQSSGYQPSGIRLSDQDPKREMFSQLGKKCIKPIQDCTSIHRIPASKKLTHCIEKEEHDPKKCDSVLHGVFNFFYNRYKVRNDYPEVINSATKIKMLKHLMPPKSCVEELKTSFNISPSPNPRDEL